MTKTAPALSDRVRQRLETLNVCLVVLRASGETTVQSRRRPVEQLIVDSPLFANLIRQQWPKLREKGGKPTQLWPGCWVVPLPFERRRGGRGGGDAAELHAAFLLTPAVLESEPFQLICDTQQIDRRGLIAQLDPVHLVGHADVARIAGLIGWLFQDGLELDRRQRELTLLSQQLGESYEELSLLYKLSANMLVSQPPAQFLNYACHELLQVIGVKWIALQLTPDEPRLNDLVGQLFPAGAIGCDAGALRRIGQQLISRLPVAGQPLIAENAASLGIEQLAAIGGNVFVVPLTHERQVIGIIFGADKLDGSPISSVDTKLCSSLAGSLSIFVENTMLYADMHAMFLGTLHALTSAIDAKDSYTHGHSERVALLSRTLAAAAGLDEHTIERVYLAGLVHDLGKIGVPEAVLCKPGALTTAEFDMVKQHPVIGARILQDIRQMDDLIPGVMYHHERWDGRGYPKGLAGTDIPLLGRVICLADSYDAMCSSRTYRGAMPPAQACEEINRCTGTQFDPQLANIFVNIDFAPFLDMLDAHHRTRSAIAAPSRSNNP